jgi:Ras family protein
MLLLNKRINILKKKIKKKDDYFLLVPQKHSYNISGYILIYSVENRNSFEMVKIIREKLFQLNGRNIPSILVANKKDIMDERRKVRTTEGKALADLWGTPFMEISTKYDDMNYINYVFKYLVEDMEEDEDAPTNNICKKIFKF